MLSSNNITHPRVEFEGTAIINKHFVRLKLELQFVKIFFFANKLPI